VYLAFCLVMGGLQGRSFWEMVSANEQLRDHAAAQARAHDELRAEVARRLQVEVELRQAQKLEAIGRLAAGLAHEINTPVQFVTDSCQFLGDGLHDLEAGLADYRALVEDLLATRVTADAARAQVERIEAMHDLAYLRDHLGEAADRALDGLGRVAKIVRATKEFSRSSETKLAADLNSAIENTLVICRSETSQVADVVVDLGELPPVLCQIGELNQVFLNILINAAHAIGDAGPARGTITISTRAVAGWVKIAITDTGTGIPPEHLDKIYEPFFTTKEVGRGTGQGLAIARSIVVGKHGGRIDVASRVGNGTTFTIWLPS
jgi:signal transduction histidine kinase